jgi:large subunit ribosomal protein L6
MSRIGRKPISMPSGVTVDVKEDRVTVKGPLGTLEERIPSGFAIENKEGVLQVKPTHAKDPALYGTLRARVANAVSGVATGFTKALDIVGLGFKAAVEGEKLQLNIGFSHPVFFTIPKGIKVVVDPKTQRITISGAYKDQVGQVAAAIRSLRPPEPYKATGIRYVGEHIVRKAGKTAAGVGGGTAAGAKK